MKTYLILLCVLFVSSAFAQNGSGMFAAEQSRKELQGIVEGEQAEEPTRTLTRQSGQAAASQSSSQGDEENTEVYSQDFFNKLSFNDDLSRTEDIEVKLGLDCCSRCKKIDGKLLFCNPDYGDVLEDDHKSTITELRNSFVQAVKTSDFKTIYDLKTKLFTSKLWGELKNIENATGGEACGQCYAEAFDQIKSEGSAADSVENFKQVEDKLYDQLHESALSDVIREAVYAQAELNRFYEDHKNEIDKAAKKDKPKGLSDKAYLNELMCLPKFFFNPDNKTSECKSDKSAEYFNNILEAWGVEKAKDVTDLFEDSGKVYKKLNNLKENMYKKFKRASWNGVFKSKKQEKNFDDFYTNLVISKKAMLEKSCADKSLNLEKQWEIFASDDTGESAAAMRPEQMNKRIETIKTMFLTTNLMEPKFQIITNNPDILCQVIKLSDELIRKNGMLASAKPIVDNTYSNVYEEFKMRSQRVCNNDDFKKEIAKVACGEITETRIPIRLDVSNLSKSENIAYQKMQCMQKINIVDFNKNNSGHKFRDRIFDSSEGRSWRDVRRNHQALLARSQQALTSGQFSAFLNSDQSGVTEEVNFEEIKKENEACQGAMAAREGGLFSKRSDSGDWIDEMFPVGPAPGGIDRSIGPDAKSFLSDNNKNSSEIQQSAVSDKQAENIFNNFQNNGVTPQPQTNTYNSLQEYVQQPVNMDEAKDAEAKANADLEKILSKLSGADPNQQLLDYLTPKSGKEISFNSDVSPAEEKELRAQIESLRNEIAESRMQKYNESNKSLSDQLREANERIARLEEYLKSQGNGFGGSNSGRSPAGVSAGEGAVVGQSAEGRKFQEGAGAQGQTANGNYTVAGSGSNQTTLNGNNSPINLRNAQDLVDMVKANDGVFTYYGHELILKSKKENQTYRIDKSKIKIDITKDGNKKLIYEDKEILVSELDENSQKEIEKFEKENPELLLVNMYKEAIEIEAELTEAPSARTVTRIQVVCTFSPELPECK